MKYNANVTCVIFALLYYLAEREFSVVVMDYNVFLSACDITSCQAYSMCSYVFSK